MINAAPSWLPDIFRSFFAALDSIGYFFLKAVYDIFFTVASAQILQGGAINTFYSRVQLILGIFMSFKLSLTLLQIIINPDAFKDKQKGIGSLVTRIAIMLVMLTLVIPINFSTDDNNELNTQIKNNGILFGFLYQFQTTIIQENILGKIVLGSKQDATSSEDGLGFSNMKSVGEQLTSVVAKAFIRPTLKTDVDEDAVVSIEDYQDNIACDNGEANAYFNPAGVSSASLIQHLNDTCEYNSDEIYVFDYAILGGLICSVVMTIIILGFTVDIAIRAIKLAILRLIAPIPIISYIDPAQGKDGPFNNWVKTLTSTYLSLFIRLMVLYFGIYLIVLLTDSSDDFVIWQNSTSVFTSFFATIFIIIGILMFMKEAPKFFQDMLGIKGDGKLFSGIGAMLGAAALTGGLAGSVIGSYRTGKDEARELGLSKGEAFRHSLMAGAGGLFGGAYAGTKALMSADKKQASAVFSAMQKRNTLRSSGSTFLGRTKSGASALFMGSSLGGIAAKKAELFDSLTKAAQAHKSMAEDEAIQNNDLEGSFTLANGDVITGNYQDIISNLQQARAEGKDYMVLANGNKIDNIGRINENVLKKIKESQTENFLVWQRGLSESDPDYNNKVAGTAKDLEYAANKVGMNINAYQYGGTPTDPVKGIKGVIGASINAARDIKSDPRMQFNIADDKAINNTNK